MRAHPTRLSAALMLLLVGSAVLFAIGSTIERHKHRGEQKPAAASAPGEKSHVSETRSDTTSTQTATHAEKIPSETAGSSIVQPKTSTEKQATTETTGESGSSGETGGEGTATESRTHVETNQSTTAVSTVARSKAAAKHHPAATTTTSAESTPAGSEGTSSEGANHVEKGHSETGATILGVNTESVALTIVAVVSSILLALAVWLGRWPRLVLLAVAGFGLVFAAGDTREVVHQLNESNGGLAAVAAILIGLHLAVTTLAALLFTRRGGSAKLRPAERPA